MKISILIACLLLTIASCKFPFKKEVKEEVKKDSISQTMLMEKEKAIADSIEQAERYEQANTAFGRIQFGMNREEVRTIMNQDLLRGKSKAIGLYQYTFVPIFNDSDQLYLLQLNSDPESSLNLETSVKAKVNSLKEIISVKYGEPLNVFKYPDDFDFVEKTVQWVYTWEFDSKIIKVGVASEKTVSEFKALCHIYDNPKRSKYLNRDKELHKARVEKAAEDF